MVKENVSANAAVEIAQSIDKVNEIAFPLKSIAANVMIKPPNSP
jgi:hypothetical protein